MYLFISLAFWVEGRRDHYIPFTSRRRLKKSGIIRDKIALLKVLELIYAHALCDLYVYFEN